MGRNHSAATAALLAASVAFSPAVALAAQERVPIDLGDSAPGSALPSGPIDILVPPPATEAANAAVVKECENQREAGIVGGEIVVCRALEVDTTHLYSGSREDWLKNYAGRTQGAGTIAPPDVDRTGLVAPMVTITGFCFIPPCPKDPALIVDVEAIETPPPGSDAERVAQGLAPLEADDAPLSAEERRRKEADLGLPEAPKASE